MGQPENTFRVDAAGMLRGARFIPSPNFDERPPGCPIRLLVIHSISLPPNEFGGPGIIELFTNCLDPSRHPYYETIEGLRVSAHFLIRRDGEIIQFVPCGLRAWHAGVSEWRGIPNCNDFSIGVEVEGSGESAFESPQYESLARLTAALRAAYPLDDIAGHSEIAPARKTDPGPRFDWDRFQRLLAHVLSH